MVSPKDSKHIGQMAYCRRGRLGMVTKVRYDKQGRPVFLGYTVIKGKWRNWQTVQPTWIKRRD